MWSIKNADPRIDRMENSVRKDKNSLRSLPSQRRCGERSKEMLSFTAKNKVT